MEKTVDKMKAEETERKKTIDELEHEEIERRMIWYNKAFASDTKRGSVSNSGVDATSDEDEDGGGGGGGEADLPTDGKIKDEPIENFLQNFEKHLHHQPIQMCIRKPVCKCKVKMECSCDSDNYFTSLNVRGEMGNLCRYSVHLCFEGKLKIKKDFKSILRFFYFSEAGSKIETKSGAKDEDEDKEVVLFDIVPLTLKREDEINSFDIIIYPDGVVPAPYPLTSSSSSATPSAGGYGVKSEVQSTAPPGAKKFPVQEINFDMSILDVSFNYLMED